MNFFIPYFKNVMDFIYHVCGDYGTAIVLFTVFVRLLLLPLNAKQRKSLEAQKNLSKKIEEIKKNQKNNTEKMNQEIQKVMTQERGMGTGCLLTILQFPIMMCLYRTIQLTVTAGTSTFLLPWVTSLLLRDPTFLLPIATILLQSLPLCYPYLGFFQKLNLPKSNPAMILAITLTTGMFSFALPCGVGLYYFVSSLFGSLEQFIVHAFAVRKLVLSE